eukprot:scaffold2351_cov403-Prasinococcus_capsulatus_cf.AAC.17
MWMCPCETYILSVVTFRTVIESPFMSNELMNVPEAILHTVTGIFEKYCMAARAQIFSSIKVDEPRLLTMITTLSTLAVQQRVAKSVYLWGKTHIQDQPHSTYGLGTRIHYPSPISCPRS